MQLSVSSAERLRVCLPVQVVNHLGVEIKQPVPKQRASQAGKDRAPKHRLAPTPSACVKNLRGIRSTEEQLDLKVLVNEAAGKVAMLRKWLEKQTHGGVARAGECACRSASL